MNARILFASSLGLALAAAACGGSSENSGTTGDGGHSGSGSSSGSGSGGGSGGFSTSGAVDAAVRAEAGGASCMSAADCPIGQACCGVAGLATCQAQSACGMAGNRQFCASNTDCPTALPVCRLATGSTTGQKTCRVCNQSTCQATGQVCCRDANGPTGGCVASCSTGTSPLCTTKADCAMGTTCCAGGMLLDTCMATCPAGTVVCAGTPADCATGEVCCQGNMATSSASTGTCQAQSACGMLGNRRFCAGNADCPAALPRCAAPTGAMAPLTCRAALTDGGVTDSGRLGSDAASTPDSAAPETGTIVDAAGGA